MNLQTEIRPALWRAVANAYESGNYTHAILDGIHLLSELLREKSGLDGDGHSLVGAALGGQSPVLRINRLQTETERNIQKGIEQILRGIYQGIRNPRSHEQIEDTKEAADAIVHFISYLVSVLDESEEPFTIQRFIDRVFDSHFVKSARYSELLVSEVPVGRRLDVLIEMYRRKREGDGENLKYVTHELLNHLSPEQVHLFLSVVSEELRITSEVIDIKTTLHILPVDHWPSLEESARLRTEGILFKSIEVGSIYSDGTSSEGSSLGTWARNFLGVFTQKQQAGNLLLKKLHRGKTEQRYVFKHFLTVLPSLFDTSHASYRCISAIAEAIKEDIEGDLIEILKSRYWHLPKNWQAQLKEEIPDYELISEEDIPF